MKGIRLDIAEFRRPDPQTAPCHSKAAGLYMICTISKHKAERKGYADALMLDWQGRVAECTGANVFFTRDGALHTPIADCFLDGITRRTVIDLAKKRGLEVQERRIMPDELPSFNECFICGTGAEVTPGRRDRPAPLHAGQHLAHPDRGLCGGSAPSNLIRKGCPPRPDERRTAPISRSRACCGPRMHCPHR